MEKSMNAEFWEERWRTHYTAWDLGRVSPPLAAYIDQLTDKHQRILIPGCGNTYEAEYLLQNGFTNITVVDISPTLTDRLKTKFAGYLNQQLRVICADFFELKGEFDLILEQTFFCALHPQLRPAYVNKMSELLAPGGKLVGVLFDTEFEKEGPPFGGSAEEYRQRFDPAFETQVLAPCYNSHPARSGTEVFINLKKL